MSKKAWIISLGLLLGLISGCGSTETVVEITKEVEVTRIVEVIKEVEVEAEPFATVQPNVQPAIGGGRLDEVSGQLMVEDEQSTGQEDRARPTPLAPRDKQSSSTQSEEINSTQIAQVNAGEIDVVETAVASDLSDTASPRSEDPSTPTPIVNTSSVTTTTSTQLLATSSQLPEPSPSATLAPIAIASVTASLSRWAVMNCGTFH